MPIGSIRGRVLLTALELNNLDLNLDRGLSYLPVGFDVTETVTSLEDKIRKALKDENQNQTYPGAYVNQRCIFVPTRDTLTDSAYLKWLIESFIDDERIDLLKEWREELVKKIHLNNLPKKPN
jgi:hypothetical protein